MVVIIDLLFNLMFLVGLTVVAVLVRYREDVPKHIIKIIIGVLFGAASVLGMLRPLHFLPGVIFDGRSIMISICGLFFGPVSAGITAIIAGTARVLLGGDGTLMGVMVVCSSAIIGCAARRILDPEAHPPRLLDLYLFGLAVHVVMVALMVLLPRDLSASVLMTLAPIILITYPFATVLAGTVLTSQMTARRYLAELQERQQFIHTVMEHLPVGVAVHTLPPDGRFTYFNSTFHRVYQVDPDALTTLDSFWEAA